MGGPFPSTQQRYSLEMNIERRHYLGAMLPDSDPNRMTRLGEMIG
jgi:hypothetical protein